MNSKETIVRNCIEAKRREADSYQNPGCYNAAFCRGYVEGASETLSTLLSPAENSTEAFVILSHYSNENIGHFLRLFYTHQKKTGKMCKKTAFLHPLWIRKTVFL